MPKQKLSEVDPSLIDKVCTECLTRKPLAEFGVNSKGRLGRLSKCKLCCAEKASAKRAADPEAARAKERSYYKPHPRNPPKHQWPDEKVCNNCTVVKALDLFYNDKTGRFGRYSKCIECMIAIALERYAEHGESIRAHMRAKRDADPIAAKAYAAEWRRKNPEAARAIDANKRHQRRALIKTDKVTAQEWADLREMYGYICLCCLRDLDELFELDMFLTMDHVTPLSKDGRHLIENLQPLCQSCNSKKWTDCTDYRPQPA